MIVLVTVPAVTVLVTAPAVTVAVAVAAETVTVEAAPVVTVLVTVTMLLLPAEKAFQTWLGFPSERAPVS